MLDIKRRNFFYAVQIALFSIGLFFLSVGTLSSFSWRAIPFNIGITFIATSFIAFFNKWLLDEDSNNKKQELLESKVPPPEIIVPLSETIVSPQDTTVSTQKTNASSIEDKWGLVTIYENRSEKNRKVNRFIAESGTEIDVMTQNSLRGLRKSIEEELKVRLEYGLRMRILTPSDMNDPQHVNEIEDLINWCNGLDRNQRGNIEIHSYDGTPQDLYFRVNDMIFVGPYFLGERANANDKTITYEFNKDSEGGKIYSNYFRQIWRDSKKIELKP